MNRTRNIVGLLILVAFLCVSVNAIQKAMMPSRFLRAAEQGDVALVQQMLDRGVDVNTKDGWNSTAIMYAAVNGHTDVVRVLLSKGAKLNEPSRLRRTPLMWAVQGGNDVTVQFLLGQGADLTVHDQFGDTAFALANKEGYGAIAQLIKNAAARRAATKTN